MDWERIDSTIAQAFRKNGHEIPDVPRARTPLSELIAREPLPDLDAMTEQQMCEFAADHHIAVAEGLSREQLAESIKNALEQNWEERIRGMVGMLDYIYQDGPHPLAVYRRMTTIVKGIRPKLVFFMSFAELAVLCDDGKGETCDGRATQQARFKRLFEKPIQKAGMRGFKAPHQKGASTSAGYSAAAQGNQNRLGKAYLREQEQQQQPKRKKAA